jgi:1,4-dihydroxy-2-naphthoate octaprenyltransferase
LIFGLAHLSVSFSNDYFDRNFDRNSNKTLFSGGSKVLIEHPELEGLALKIAIFLLSSSIISGAIFTIVYSYSIYFFLFGLIGGLVGWFYTAPPLKLAYRGLGELATTFSVSVLMPGFGYLVASGSIDQIFLFFIFLLSCYGLFFILTVESPDIESDTIANKTNILVKLGKKAGTQISALVTLFGTIYLVAIYFYGILERVLDIRSIALISIIPLISAIFGLLNYTNRREKIVQQVMLNMSSMISFLLLLDIILLYKLI